jgi:ABC-type transporter Mla subunit MlaD
MESRAASDHPEQALDPLVAILSAQAAASEKQTEALGALGRLVATLDRTHDSELRKLTDALRDLAAEVRGALNRLGPLELEVDFLRSQRLGRENGHHG